MLPRYQDSEIASIFDRANTVRLWEEIELAVVAERWGGKMADELGGYTRAHQHLDWIDREERTTHHDVVAFLNVWRAQLPPEDRDKIHDGLTSSDITDTALGMQLLAAGVVIDQKLSDLYSMLADVATRLEDNPQVGRTHGQRATTRMASRPWWVFRSMWYRQSVRLSEALDDARVGKLSGPVGAYTTLTPEQEEHILAELGLHAIPSTQIVPRDLLADAMRQCSALLTLMEAVATNLRLSAITEVGEFREGRGIDQIGSSSIPHKRNPLTCERVCGMARMGRGYASQLEMSVVQWWDRDLAHSSVEREFVPGLLHLTCKAMDELATVLEFAEFDADQMQEHVDSFRDTARELDEAVAAGADREEAHRTLRGAAAVDRLNLR